MGLWLSIPVTEFQVFSGPDGGGPRIRVSRSSGARRQGRGAGGGAAGAGRHGLAAPALAVRLDSPAGSGPGIGSVGCQDKPMLLVRLSQEKRKAIKSRVSRDESFTSMSLTRNARRRHQGAQRRSARRIFGTRPKGRTPRTGLSVAHTCHRRHQQRKLKRRVSGGSEWERRRDRAPPAGAEELARPKR